jgi:thiamine biosynthesis lipoprotein
MGVDFRIIFYADDRTAATDAAAAAFARIAQINSTHSNYLPDSELNRLCRTAGSGQDVPLSDDLFRVLNAAQELARKTNGAFDVTVGPYTKLWRRARRRKQLPAPAQLNRAQAAVGYQHLQLDTCRRTATLLRPDMRIDLGGIAKGYAADEALKVLQQHGITRALVDGSGDIAVGQAPPGRKGWRIAISALDRAHLPRRVLLLTGAAVATSGDAWQHVVIEGRRYSHIVDPQTGLGLTSPRSVTVVADQGMRADSLASALSVLEPAKGLALMQGFPAASALIVERTENGIATHESRGFQQHLVEE